MKTQCLILGFALSLPAFLAAHEGELHKAAKEAKAAVVEAGKAVAAGAKEAGQALTAAGKELSGAAVVQVEPLELVKRHARSHWHNKLVHFPIALGLLGVLFMLASLRWPSAASLGRWSLFLAALGSLAAIVTGLQSGDEYDGTSLVKALELHEDLGKATGLGLLAAWLLSFFDGAKKWAWVAYLGLAGLISFMAALGGAIAHS